MERTAFERAASEHVDFAWWPAAVRHTDENMSRDGSHDWGHLLRVLRNAAAICTEHPEADWEIISAATLMHDIVNLPKDHPERSRASSMSADVAHEFFTHVESFDTSMLEKLGDAIRSHSYSAGLAPEYLESKVLSDADRLEALGAFGIARCFQVSGQLDRALLDMDDPFADDRELDDLEFAVDHFFTKLLHLEERFHTDAGRRLATQRTEFIRAFVDQLEDELDPTRS